MKVKCPKCGGKSREINPGAWWQCRNKACLTLIYNPEKAVWPLQKLTNFPPLMPINQEREAHAGNL